MTLGQAILAGLFLLPPLSFYVLAAYWLVKDLKEKSKK